MKALERPDGYHIPPKWSEAQGTPRPIRCVNCCHASQDDTRRLYCLALGTEHPPIVSQRGTCDRAERNPR